MPSRYAGYYCTVWFIDVYLGRTIDCFPSLEACMVPKAPYKADLRQEAFGLDCSLKT